MAGENEADDGFDSAEEREAWAAMQGIGQGGADSAPAAGDSSADGGGAAPGQGAADPGAGQAGSVAGGAAGKPVAGKGAQADAAADAAGADAGGDEDDEGDDAGAAAGAEGAAAGQQGQGGKARKRRVPLRRYERDISSRDQQIAELNKRLAESDLRGARFEERMAILNEALGAGAQRPGQQQGQQDDPEPDPEQDVFGWIQWSRRRHAALEETIDSMRGESAQQQNNNSLAATYETDAQAFTAKNQDFPQAYNFLLQSRFAEWAQILYGIDVFDPGATMSAEQATQIKDRISGEERNLVAGALKTKRSPAAQIYQLAKARGYRKPDAAAAAAAGTAGAGAQNGAGGAQQRQQPQNGQAANQRQGANGQADAAGAGGEGGGNVREEIERVQRGAAAADSLSNASGGAPAIALTPQQLADMPQDEFDALMDRLPPEQARRLMGGP